MTLKNTVPKIGHSTARKSVLTHAERDSILVCKTMPVNDLIKPCT